MWSAEGYCESACQLMPCAENSRSSFGKGNRLVPLNLICCVIFRERLVRLVMPCALR